MFTKEKKDCVLAVMSSAKDARFVMRKTISNTRKEVRNLSNSSIIDSDVFVNCARIKDNAHFV